MERWEVMTWRHFATTTAATTTWTTAECIGTRARKEERMDKYKPTRAILALVAGGLELALWAVVLLLCLLVALFIGGVAWTIGDVFFENTVGVAFGLAAVVGSLCLMY